MTAVLGLIPARGGSKRIPRKNIKTLGNAPLIAWTISAARQSSYLDHVVVSSEDQEIIETARSWGAEIIRRPHDLASDKSNSYPLILHALDVLPRPYEYVCLLQPTSPFRIALDIDRCVETAMSRCWPVVSVEYGFEHPNGAVYVAPVSWLRESLSRGQELPFDSDVPVKVSMPTDRSMDLDTMDDWNRAEEFVEARAA